MSSPVTVSFIIPCFNCRATVVETALSALSQQDSAVEVVIIDDGSTDEPEVALRDAGLLDRLTFVRQENQGVSAARNHGLSLSNGRYVTFLDADDLVDPRFASSMVQLLETRQGRFAYCNYEYFADTAQRPALNIRYPVREGHVLGHLLNENFIPTPGAVLLERSVLDGLRFDSRLQGTEDWWMWMQISIHEPVHYNPEWLLRIRARAGSLGGQKGGMIRNTAALFEAAETLLDQPTVTLTRQERSRFHYRTATVLLDAGRPRDAVARWARAMRRGLGVWYHGALLAKLSLRAAGALRHVDLALWNRRVRR